MSLTQASSVWFQSSAQAAIRAAIHQRVRQWRNDDAMSDDSADVDVNLPLTKTRLWCCLSGWATSTRASTSSRTELSKESFGLGGDVDIRVRCAVQSRLPSPGGSGAGASS